MPDIQTFRLPDAGEGLTEAEIVTWRVKPGDTVRVNDTIVEIETAKSLVELPSPYAGVVTELLVAEGVTVDVGTPIIAVDTAPGGPAGAPGTTPRTTAVPDTAPDAPAPGEDPTRVEDAPAEGAVEPGMIGGPAPGGRTSVLVGYGPRTSAAARRPRTRRNPPAPSPAIMQSAAIMQSPAITAPAAADVEASAPLDAPAARAHVFAKPPVRKLAKILGVDLTTVAPSGPDGIITRDDVEHAVRPAAGRTGAAGSAAAEDGETELRRHRYGPWSTPTESRIPVKGVRRATAEAMVASAFTAPHVTEWVTVDVTRTVKLVERLREDREFAGVKVSPLLVVAKALLLAVRRNPLVNASWDGAAGEIVVKHHVNLGIAAATPRGLVVPNVKDADRLSLRQLAGALAELTATAREGRTPPADMTGGTITITNVGVFGVDSGTPILNPGEAAILAFGQVRRQPWVHKGKVRPRWVTQLALSFDHRLVDGDLGSRTLADVAAVLEDPSRALVWS